MGRGSEVSSRDDTLVALGLFKEPWLIAENAHQDTRSRTGDSTAHSRASREREHPSRDGLRGVGASARAGGPLHPLERCGIVQQRTHFAVETLDVEPTLRQLARGARA